MKKLFISDCEGPISLNDNAFEICANFIKDGDKFFNVVSAFDDYLVDVIKKENYNAGDTLKLIVPFLWAYGLNNQKIIDYSIENIDLVNGSIETMDLAKNSMNSYVVSTSYGQYIEALTDFIDFPFKNSYFTSLDMDMSIDDDNNDRLIDDDGLMDNNGLMDNDLSGDYDILVKSEKKILKSFKDKIVKIDLDKIEDNFDFLNEIFFNEIPKLKSYKIAKNVKTVGGIGKKLAIDDILALSENKIEDNEKIQIMYIGDSITDVEPLTFAKNNDGIAISFNGNEYALNAGEIAVISNHTIANSLLIYLHRFFNKDYVLEFVRAYSKDPDYAFENFRVSFDLIDTFKKLLNEKKMDLPIIEIITNENKDFLLEKSIKMRKAIRGQDIGNLG
ncbi:MAG: hypothetical protein LBM96_01910 [Methanobrevibacter sp.]|jgi:energy-converting hydrogenase A subunit R|nr:hypothetical protein [Candidatus Methanoflexus mossambicus]